MQLLVRVVQLLVFRLGVTPLFQRCLNEARAMNDAANTVGGVGGGHDIAAGATIPEGTEIEFLKQLDQLVGLQLS